MVHINYGFFPFYQADICHAYQLLRKGGLKEENIIVFMYNDIAYNEENPRLGTIINSPNGDDVYQGVPKVCYLPFSYPMAILIFSILICEVYYGRIIVVMMSLLTTFMLSYLEIKVLLQEGAGRL